MTDLSDAHHCAWQEEAQRLRAELDKAEGLRAELDDVRGKLAAVTAAMEALTRRVLGPKSEKVPPPEKELRKDESDDDAEARQLATLARRRERAALKEKLRSETVVHHLGDDQRQCPSCGGTADRALGGGKQTFLYDYVPGYFVRQCHIQEKAACSCGQFIATANAPARPIEGGHYSARFMAHIAVMKCADALPLHRLAKQYQRLGIPMSRSTLTDLFHAAAAKLAPLWQRALWLVAQSDIVQADETSLVMQKPFRRSFVWTFLSDEIIAYRFAADRSGATPLAVLGGTQGTLVVDAYTGYNRVVDVDGRSRASCLAHVRRKFFEALTSHPEPARRALDLILEIYRVEHDAKLQGIVRTDAHLRLRQTRGREAMNTFLAWLEAEQANYPPVAARALRGGSSRIAVGEFRPRVGAGVRPRRTRKRAISAIG